MFETKRGGAKMKNKKGFTLVELLVVIAIIGILSSVAVVNLNSARDKAKFAAAQATLSGLSPIITLCLNDGGNLTNSGTAAEQGTNKIPIAGSNLCDLATVTENWPTLPSGANYSNLLSSSDTAGTWAYKANAAGNNINCTQTGCN